MVNEDLWKNIKFSDDTKVKIEDLSAGLKSTGGPIPVFVVNYPEGGIEKMMDVSRMADVSKDITNSSAEVAKQGMQNVSQDLVNVSAEIANNTKEASAASTSWLSSIKNAFGSIGGFFSDIFSKVSSWFSGGAGGGSGAMSAISGIASIASNYMQEGGRISEPVVGRGLQSGEFYHFGERTKYGEDEIVAPMDKLRSEVSSENYHISMPINLSAIDSVSGIQFLQKNMHVIENQIVKSMKNNRPIRKGIVNAY